MIDYFDRISGGFWGLLIGDALGVPYEFHSSDSLPPLNQIEMKVPNGFERTYKGVPEGTWSDDGAQALCLLDSLLEENSLNLNHFARKLISWYKSGKWTVDNIVFDVGKQTAAALEAFLSGMPPERAGFVRPEGKGNGSLMRVLPLALWHTGNTKQLVESAHTQSLVTHGHITNQVCCALYCLWARGLLQGHDQDEAYKAAVQSLRTIYGNSNYREELETVLRPDDNPVTDGSGYVVSTFNCARLALKEKSFESAVKVAISYGGDTDTNAAVVGGLAGIVFGFAAIPERWRKSLRGYNMAETLLDKLMRSIESNLNHNWGDRQIPSSELTPLDIPQLQYVLQIEGSPRNKSDFTVWNQIWKFALTFNGYEYLGDQCHDFSSKAFHYYRQFDMLRKDLSLDDLRILLFMQQRGWRWRDGDIDESQKMFVDQLLREIYQRLRNGEKDVVHGEEFWREKLFEMISFSKEDKAYYRPFVCNGRIDEIDIFLVGINPATPIYPNDIDFHEYVELLLHNDKFLEYYSKLRLLQGKTEMSRTRIGMNSMIDLLKQHTNVSIAETNVISYPTKSVKELKQEPKEVINYGKNIFYQLLSLIQPKILIFHSKEALKIALEIMSERELLQMEPRMIQQTDIKELELKAPLLEFTYKSGKKGYIFACRHLMYYGKKGDSFQVFTENVIHMMES
ncbi:ADP-ribosylglycohydrolase family protein [Ectobacillus sp. sgz5001026]|uniref:ADP-ribosylglycohydrolase family protein n=1 Tax=Ectobacillus sp. sgz5001026 TaxID=3242473 RepID=UPI0036D3EA35